MSATEQSGQSFDQLLAEEQAKIPKLKILFGPWWRHYAVPYEFRWTLYAERKDCPYCGERFGGLESDTEPTALWEASAHLDHMDPVSRGGEDSIRNAVYVCAQCNMTKRNRLFIDWMAMLEPVHRDRARLIYVDKHDHPPEAFVPGTRQARLTLPRTELKFDEAVLSKLFPKPIVNGPPTRMTAEPSGSESHRRAAIPGSRR